MKHHRRRRHHHHHFNMSKLADKTQRNRTRVHIGPS